MKTIIALSLILVGCSRPPAPTHPATERLQPALEYVAQSIDPATFQQLTNALALATNKDDVLPIMAAAIYDADMDRLSREPRGNLLSKLDSLARGTNRHHYTRAELEEALRRGDARRAEKVTHRQSTTDDANGE